MSYFDLVHNSTQVMQGFYSEGELHRVPPNCVIDLQGVRPIPKGFVPVKDFMRLAGTTKDKSFYISRSFALGDTLMAVPVVRYCQGLGYKVQMRVADQYLEMMRRLEVESESCNSLPPTDTLGIVVDGVVERDHGNSPLRNYHRVKIYFMVLGTKQPSVHELNWDWDPDRFPPNPVTEGNYVVFLGHGANTRKQLPAEAIRKVCLALNEEGVKVYYTGSPRFDHDERMTVHTGSTWTKSQLFPAIAGARCFVTMDSGPLWVAHFTKTPVVGILGPTGGEQHRLAYHPLWPEGVVALRMDKWAGCDTCFEATKPCNYTVRCLNSNADRLVEEVVKGVKRFWGV